ncbi:MAG: hypothetical protein AAF575_13430, partial [Bacteroidota bacterium]
MKKTSNSENFHLSKKLILGVFGFFLGTIFSFGQTVSIADVTGDEDDGAIEVTLSLDTAVLGGFSLEVSTNNGSATLVDGDYAQVNGLLVNFSGFFGETQTFDVVPTADTRVELDETLTITMANLSGTLAAVDISDTAT